MIMPNLPLLARVILSGVKVFYDLLRILDSPERARLQYALLFDIAFFGAVFLALFAARAPTPCPGIAL